MSNKSISVKKSRLFLFFFLILFGTVFEGYSQSLQSNNNLEEVTLQLKWRHQFQFAGYYAALEKGFYRQAGLAVKIMEVSEAQDSTRQVVSGKADFGIAMSDLIQQRAKGEPVVALASIFQHSPLIILAPKMSGIENIHDLKGKKISLESHSEQILSYLRSEGLSSHKLIIYPHDYDITKLISGEIDAMSAYSTDEPFLLLSKGIEYSIFSPRAGGIDFYGDTLFTSESQINAHPERVAAFLEASLKGWKYALGHTEEIVDLILSKYTTRHSREHLLFEARMSKRLIMADVVELGYMNPGRWLHIANSFKELNRIPNDFSLDGFIYDRTPAPDLRWVYLSIIGTILIAGIAFYLASWFYKMNQLLKIEIKQREKADARVQDTLKEKELLLKEVHHRIRNNMATIKGLLFLQSETLNNVEAKMALKEAENRVQSMLVLYDKLFLSSDFQNVSTKQYFETLIDDVIQNFPNKDIVSVTYEIEDVMLSAKIIFDLGIIINELIHDFRIFI